MIFLSLSSLILFYNVWCEKSVTTKSLTPETKIIGGSAAPDGGIPYQVSLRQSGSHFCGATLLNKRWILTAAHCTVAFPKDVIVAVLGTNSLVSGGENYNVEEVIIHEDFDQDKILNDISLIKVTEDIKFSDRVQPIDLPKTKTKPGANVLLTGWGKESDADDSPVQANLQMLNQTVIDLKLCQFAFNHTNVVTENQICSVKKNGDGACQGDSGGPLVENNRVVGIVSWGVDCRLLLPDVATYVFRYTDWINKYINSE